jgi:3-deoxy-D-manno-octulosonic-acid transferase
MVLPETRARHHMTPTGANQVRRLLAIACRIAMPYDFPWALRRFMKRTAARADGDGAVAEHGAYERGARHSGRIDQRASISARRGYRRIGGMARAMLSQLTWIAARYSEHAQRHRTRRTAGVVDVVGNVKFDVEMPGDLSALRIEALARPVAVRWIAASCTTAKTKSCSRRLQPYCWCPKRC